MTAPQHNGPGGINRVASLSLSMVFANVVLLVLTEQLGLKLSEALTANAAMLIAAGGQWLYSRFGGIGG